ncbi:MAG: dienelactone hydrolase family protein [Rhodoferax sp.]|nr:dienelactone hydrolase family protein [Rhodoferax sp.]
MKTLVLTLALASGFSASIGAALAQDAKEPEAVWLALEQGKKAKPIAFAQDVKEREDVSEFKNQLVKPAGKGLFPAVVIMSSCAGVNDALVSRAKELLDAGFAVLTVDSFGPRNKQWWACLDVMTYQMADTFDALKHLQKFDVINKQRIFGAGWSTGIMGPMVATSPEGRKQAGSELGFAAVVSHYGNCMYQEKPSFPPVHILRNDVDKPVLMLLAESDVPVSNCFPLLEELKKAGKPVEFHTFSGAHHLWDRADETRVSRENGFGQKITFKYSPDITKDATQRMVDFFNRFK